MLRVIGPLLLILGLAGLAVGAFSFTRDKKVVDVGPIEVHSKDRDRVAIPPLLAGGVAVIGAVLTVAALRGKR